jgi:hypothetical protein
MSDGDQGHFVPPRTLKGFPNAVRDRPKTPMSGRGLRARWKDTVTGDILEWDYRHGTVEVYDAQGRHRGEFHPVSSDRIKAPDPSRRVEP